MILRPDGSERSVEWYTIPMQYLGGEARMYAPLDFTELALFCDLDGFKKVNDTHGHDAGDDVLTAVASRLDAAVRDDEVVARIAGDEFVVADASVAASIATRLLAVVAQPIRVGDGTLVRVGASIGIAELHSADDAARLLGRADAAMYAAKRAGKGRASRAVRGLGRASLRATQPPTPDSDRSEIDAPAPDFPPHLALSTEV